MISSCEVRRAALPRLLAGLPAHALEAAFVLDVLWLHGAQPASRGGYLAEAVHHRGFGRLRGRRGAV